MLVKPNAGFNINHIDHRGLERMYAIWEPMASGYDDPTECVGIGEGVPRTYIPPEAFQWLCVAYLRHHGFVVVGPDQVTLAPARRNGKGQNGSSPVPDVRERG